VAPWRIHTQVIDEKEGSVDTIKIDRLCSTRRIADESQPALPRKSIQQAGFAYVTSP
jgi:hypothetical protein